MGVFLQKQYIEQLANPRKPKDSTMYIVHWCGKQILPQSGHIVQVPAAQGKPFSLEEVYRCIARALDLPRERVVVAIYSLEGLRIVHPSDLRDQQHIMYLCKGDKPPKRRPLRYANETAALILL